MLNKKSIELSLNFLVIIIISIVIFGFGVYFISRLSSEATELTQLTTSELDSKIEGLICEGFDRVCVVNERKVIRKKEFGVFGVKVLNILQDQTFDIEVKPSNPLGYRKDKSPITDPPLTVHPAVRTISIDKNEERDLAIGVQVPPNAVVGTYILNVEIKSQDGKLYSQILKLYVDVS